LGAEGSVGRVWTSSGVAAGKYRSFKELVRLIEHLLGLDMAAAFIEHLVGKEWSDKIRGTIELRVLRVLTTMNLPSGTAWFEARRW